MLQQLRMLYIITINLNLAMLYVSFTTVMSRKYHSLSYYVIFCEGLGQLSLDLFLSFHIVAQTMIYAVFCL